MPLSHNFYLPLEIVEGRSRRPLPDNRLNQLSNEQRGVRRPSAPPAVAV